MAQDTSNDFTLEKIQELERIEQFENKPSFNISKGLREKHNLGINASFGSSAVLGLTIDYFITENVSLELSLLAGYIPGVFGIKTYFTPKDNWSVYLGLHVTAGFYTPIGIEYMHESGFKISFEVGPAIIPNLNISWGGEEDDYSSSTNFMLIPWGGIKIGYYF
jgi:hypothetical protein